MKVKDSNDKPSAIKAAASDYISKTADKDHSKQKSVAADNGKPKQKKQSDAEATKTTKDQKTLTATEKTSGKDLKGISRQRDAASANSSNADSRKEKSVDVGSPLNGVVFALSGFENPLRAELREKACEMGATYKPDWITGCTHLICAFANTPKYNKVKGKGKIVKKEWILDCYREKKLLPWQK